MRSPFSWREAKLLEKKGRRGERKLDKEEFKRKMTKRNNLKNLSSNQLTCDILTAKMYIYFKHSF